MALKAKLTQEEFNQLTEDLAGAYTQQTDGSFLLDVQGMVLKDRLDEFRNNNINYKKRIEEMEQKLAQVDKMVDKEEYDVLKKELEKRQEEEKLAKGNVEEVVRDRMARSKKEWEDRHKILQKDLDEKNQRYEKLHSDFQKTLIQKELVTELNRVGKIRQGAEADLLARAERIWRLDDNNQLVAFKPDGTEMFGKNAERISVQEYCQDQLTDAAHCYESASGTGATGDGDASPQKPAESIASSSDVTGDLEAIAKGDKYME